MADPNPDLSDSNGQFPNLKNTDTGHPVVWISDEQQIIV